MRVKNRCIEVQKSCVQESGQGANVLMNGVKSRRHVKGGLKRMENKAVEEAVYVPRMQGRNHMYLLERSNQGV